MELDRIDTADADGIRALVRDKYGAIARDSGSCCGPAPAATGCACGCGSTTSEEAQLAHNGYTPEQVDAIPAGANLGLGCGNPLQFAAVQSGETVLDLGSGAGIDAFLAAREVGPEGRVIGVDMTPEMIDRARANAARIGVTGVEFRLGEIEHLPVADASVDVVISNCVINLSPHKPQVFREALRVLRPGGRLVVSDLVLVGDLPDEIRRSASAYVGCIAGASRREEYLAHVRDAGFQDVEVVQENRYMSGDASADATLAAGLEAVVSLKVRARKP
jgi:SAM-dependent methyltransferase